MVKIVCLVLCNFYHNKKILKKKPTSYQEGRSRPQNSRAHSLAVTLARLVFVKRRTPAAVAGDPGSRARLATF